MSDSTNSVKAYLNEIGRIELLTAGEEVELARTIEVGVIAGERLSSLPDHERRSVYARELDELTRAGVRAKERFIKANLRLVVSIAKRYADRGTPLLDLIQEGNIGLIRAVEKFDNTKGFRFSGYGTGWIKLYVTRALDSGLAFHVPSYVATEQSTLTTAEREAEMLLGRVASDGDLSEITGLSAARIRELRNLSRATVSISLDAPVGEDGGAVFGDLLVDHDVSTFDAVAIGRRAAELDAVLGLLSEADRDVILRRFGLHGHELEKMVDICADLGMARGAVYAIENRIFKKIAGLRPQLREYLAA
ncbi:MAG: sigA [Microbacteriaceae bacterium]|nr:sigA [Microbacteriaceae bacterium]